MALLEEPIKEVKVIKNYIDGEWVESKGEVVDVVNPATYQTIAKVPISTKEEIDDKAGELWIEFDRDKLLLFDPLTGKALTLFQP